MRLPWTSIFRRREYKRGDPLTRRIIEIRYSVAHALRKRRKTVGVSQKSLAAMLDAAPSTISAIENASANVSLEQALRALIQLGADDQAVADAFNPGLRRDVQILRSSIARPFFNLDGPGVQEALFRRYGWK